MAKVYGTPDFGDSSSTGVSEKSTIVAAVPTSKEDGSVTVTGSAGGVSSKAPEAKMVDLKPSETTRVYGNPEFEDTITTKEVAIEPKDMFQHALAGHLPGQATTGVGGAKKYSADLEALFDWKPGVGTSSIGSNYQDSSQRNYKLALDEKMLSLGAKSTKDLLEPKYNEAYTKVMEGKGEPVYPVTPTLENVQKYNQDKADYDARVASADAAGRAAIVEEKAKLQKEAGEFADRIAKENEKVIGPNGEMLYDPSKRAAANSILNNKVQIEAVNTHLAKAKTLPEIEAQIPALAMAMAIARNPEGQPTEFAIKETKGIVDAMMPEASLEHKAELIQSYGLWLIAHLGGKDPGPNPLTIALQKTGYNNPERIKTRMQEYMKEVAKMNDGSASRYIKGSKKIELPPPEAYKPENVEAKDFEDPNSPKKVDAIMGSLMRWNKMSSLTPDEIKLGIKDPNKSATGENEGVVAFQSYLKKKLGAESYNVTGIPKDEDMAALQIFLKQNPGMSAKDVISEAISHKGEMDKETEPLTPKKANKKAGGKKVERRKASVADF